MNFLDAHKIVYDFVDTVADNDTSNLPARRISLLKNSKSEIIDAYKLFIAHMFAFNTCSQSEYEQISSLVYSINLFVDDALITEIENCEKTMAPKCLLSPFKSKSSMEAAKAKYDVLTKKLIDHIGPIGQNHDLDVYTSIVLQEANTLKEQLRSVPNDNEKFKNQLSLINEYCYKVYSVANIDMDENDVEYFYPFAVLQYFAKNPKLDDLFGNYKSYIFSYRR
jgi:hypothetical protein